MPLSDCLRIVAGAAGDPHSSTAFAVFERWDPARSQELSSSTCADVGHQSNAFFTNEILKKEPEVRLLENSLQQAD